MKIQEFNINRVKLFGSKHKKAMEEMHTEATVKRLRHSIRDRGLKVLPGRLIEDNGYDVEIPYGRHRLEAALSEGLKTIQIAVYKWDDLDMTIEAFHENSKSYHIHDDNILQGFFILNWRDVLTKIFRECESLKDFIKAYPEIYSKLELTERSFNTIKGQMKIEGYQGVGYKTLYKLLSPEWSKYQIKKTLKEYHEEKLLFDPDIYEEQETKEAEEIKEADEIFGDPKPVEADIDIPPEKQSKEELLSEEHFKEIMDNFGEEPEESAYTHKEPEKDSRVDDLVKARAVKKAKEIEMTEELKKDIGTLFKRLQLAEDHINHDKVGVLLSMLKLTETKNAWSQMDKVPNLKNAFDMRIERLKTEFKKVLMLYALIKTNNYKVNMTMGDLEEALRGKTDV